MTQNDISILKSRLKDSNVEVTFTKADGSERVMLCTLRDDIISSLEYSEKNINYQENPNYIRVWDLDKEAWRSFKFDSVKKYDLFSRY